MPITTTTTESEPCVLEKIENPPCYYLENVSDQFKLYQKCQSIRSKRIQIFDKNSKTILVDDRKCGVLNNSQVENSNICYSSVETTNISKWFFLMFSLLSKPTCVLCRNATSRCLAFFTFILSRMCVRRRKPETGARTRTVHTVYGRKWL